MPHFTSYNVTAQPYCAGVSESLPSGAWRGVGASFENARRFQNSQNIIYGGRSPLSAERPLRLSSNLTSHKLVQTLLEKATTRTGLKVVVNIFENIYQIGRKVADDYKATMRIVFDDFLGQWNYRALPLAAPI